MKTDLTRWNRAGLKRFRYVDGNAATYLEALRQELIARFTGWSKELASNTQEEKPTESEEKHIKQPRPGYQQALDNYLKLNDNRGSIAYEIVRSFARAAHVLTEHLDAYANEGYLGTATQWENVRRLVYGLDYYPSPPASAMTYLVLHAKPGQSGLVERGLQIKHTPENGSPVVFEILEDIQVDPALNALRLEGWNRSPSGIRNNKQNSGQNSEPGDQLTLDCIVDGLRVNEPVLIEDTENGTLQPYILKNVSVVNDRTVLQLDSDVSIEGSIICNLLVHLKPVEQLEIFAPVKTQNTKSLLLEEAPDQLEQDFNDEKGNNIYVFVGKNNTGIYRKVLGINVKDRKIELNQPFVSDPNLSGNDFLVGIPEKLTRLGSDKTVYVRNGMDRLKNETVDALVYTDNSEPTVYKIRVMDSIKKTIIKDTNTNKDSYAEYGIESDSEKITIEVTPVEFIGNSPDKSKIKQIWVPPGPNQWKWKLNSFIDMAEAEKLGLEVSAIKRIARGDLCVAVCGSNLVTACAENIAEKGAGRSILQIEEQWQPTLLTNNNENFIRSQTTIFGKFKVQARLNGWDIDETEIPNKTKLTLEDKQAAELLKPRQPVVVEQEAPTRQSFQTHLQVVDKEKGTVTLDSAVPDEYVTGRTVIRANVVLAGHGETQPERILGSGNATLSNQEFLFPVSNVSFVSDATQASGVQADIRVMVDGETWMQVPRFNRSLATDPHYAVRMTEEGYLRIVFGDGVNGRRLPTGENNVRIGWRMGSGETGNLEAGSLTKPAQPHPRVEAVDQPFRCTGGNDMESVTFLRRSAPASLMTMERAVSVNDFAELAASHSSIWNARAELESPGSEQVVRVIVVPAQGGELSDTLSKKLKDFLLSHAIPGIHIELEPYVSQPLPLHITLGINSARFDPEAVKTEVRKTLLQRFTLKNRTIGAPVYLSDIYQSVEAVSGIEYSICKFKLITGEDEKISDKQFRSPEPNEVLHMKDTKDIIEFVVVETQK